MLRVFATLNGVPSSAITCRVPKNYLILALYSVLKTSLQSVYPKPGLAYQHRSVETCASAIYTSPHTEALHAEVNHVFHATYMRSMCYLFIVYI